MGAVVRGQVRAGYVLGLSLPDDSALRRLPDGRVARGATLGLVALVAVGLPTAAALGALGVAEMPFERFVAFKALFAAALGVLVTPLIARLALADVAREG